MKTNHSTGSAPRLPYTISHVAYAKALELSVEPNVYGVLRLKNGTTGPLGQRLYVEDFRTLIEGIAFQWMSRVTQALYGKTIFRRRRRRLLPNFITLEGDGVLVQRHLNVLIRKPDKFDFAEFKSTCQFQWMRSDWSMSGQGSFWMEELTGGAAVYSMKEGIGSLLPASATGFEPKPAR